MSQEGYVRQNVKNFIATIEFYHPKSNSLPSSLLNELTTQLYIAGENDEVKVILLKSGGEKAFCAGASFDELLSISNKEEGAEFFSGFANVINAIRRIPKLVVGRVHGKAVGGGVGIASAVDYCIASELASVKLSELAIGIGPFVIGPAVERKIGIASFSQMALNPTAWKKSQWAKEKGLFTETCLTIQELDERVEEFTAELATRSLLAMQEIKKMLWQGTNNWDDLLKERAIHSGTLVLSEETKQELAAFKKK